MGDGCECSGGSSDRGVRETGMPGARVGRDEVTKVEVPLPLEDIWHMSSDPVRKVGDEKEMEKEGKPPWIRGSSTRDKNE